MKVANIAVNEKKMIVNNTDVKILDAIVKINNNIYLPISDMEVVYNIKIKYYKDTNRVVIDELNKGMINATVSENVIMKFKPRALSKDVKNLKQGEIVSCYYTTSKGWRQIRTSNGIIGYVKANKLTNEYIIRHDMLEKNQADIIPLINYKNRAFVIKNKKIVLKDIFAINQNDIEIATDLENYDNSYRIWTSISNNVLNKKENEILQGILHDYQERTKFINLIMEKSIENNINGISIDMKGIKEEDLKRFAVEIAPKLREIGINTCIVLNENIEKQDYVNIVDYIVE